MVKLHDDFSEKGLTIIGVHADPNTAKATVVAQQYMHAWPSAADTSKKVFRAYGCRAYPTKFLIGVDGTVLWKGNFANAETTRLIEEELKKVDPSAVGRPGVAPESEPVLRSVEGLPRSLVSVHRALKSGRFSSAFKKAVKIRDARRSDQDAKDAATEFLQFIQDVAAWRWAAIGQNLEDEDPYLASDRFKDFKKDFKALRNYTKAIEERGEVFKDRDLRTAILLGRQYYALVEDLEAGKEGAVEKAQAFIDENPESAYSERLADRLKNGDAAGGSEGADDPSEDENSGGGW